MTFVCFHYIELLFQCSDYIGEPECYWTDWVNNYDEYFQYACDNNHFLSGIESEHDSHHEDRMYVSFQQIYCNCAKCQIQKISSN